MLRITVAVLAFAIGGCVRFLPEASVTSTGPIEEVLAPLAAASGLSLGDIPTREDISDDALSRSLGSSSRVRPAAGTGELEAVLGAVFGLPERGNAASAGAVDPWPGARSVYDIDRASVRFAGPVPVPAQPPGEVPAQIPDETPDEPRDGTPEEPLLAGPAVEPAPVDGGQQRAWRRGELDRLRSFAAAMHHEAVHLEAKHFEDTARLDQNEALLAVIEGGAFAAVLEASLAPVNAVDASAAPVRRLIDRLTAALLEDPDGAAAEGLADPHLPEVVASALHEVLELEGVERSRYILRVFGGARLMIRARDRITDGGLADVLADPPRSSEHILHPDRYLAGLSAPVTVKRGRRSGLLGRGAQLAETGTVGEAGLLRALSACLPWPEACAAADGWAGDLLTTFRSRGSDPDGGAGLREGLAWRLVFRSAREARRAASALERGLLFSQGGAWVAGPAGLQTFDEDVILEGGLAPARLRRDDRSIGFVVGGDVLTHVAALDVLMAEECKHAVTGKKGGPPGSSHDPGYRLVRAVASPLYYDETGRFDHRMRSFYGFFARHRSWPESGAVEALNPNGFPILGSWLPDEARGLLFAGERSANRSDTSVLMDLVRSLRSEDHQVGRFWSPIFSRTRGPEYKSWAFLYGALWEYEEGEGRHERSPRLVYSRETGLDGAERSVGALLDLVSYRTRAGRDARVAIAPEGLLAQWTGFESPAGFEVGFLAESLLLRRRSVLPGSSHLDLSFLWGNGLRVLSDDASGRGEFSVANGLAFGLYTSPRRSEFGLGRIWRRSILGFGAEDGRGFMDVLFMRFGG